MYSKSKKLQLNENTIERRREEITNKIKLIELADISIDLLVLKTEIKKIIPTSNTYDHRKNELVLSILLLFCKLSPPKNRFINNQ